jgi:TPP-dependent pyruvate/acetoin dehydrogenase alpha subunit
LDLIDCLKFEKSDFDGILMSVKYTPEDLIEFENDIAREFNEAKIKAPIHLTHGNEKQIIEIFEKHNIGSDDWVLASWRSHYQCLLKGVDPDVLKKAILSGRSISLCFKNEKVFSTAIVGGQLPIAAGIALSIKRLGGTGRVFCFMGDMTSETGIAHESIKYARNHELPVHFIVEDNSKSVCTDTKKSWGINKLTYENMNDEYVTYYKYSLDKYPHAGAGMRVQF